MNNVFLIVKRWTRAWRSRNIYVQRNYRCGWGGNWRGSGITINH